MDRITQDEVDALWLACRVQINVGDVPRNLKRRAQLRIQRLASAGIISHQIGKYPTLNTEQPQ